MNIQALSRRTVRRKHYTVEEIKIIRSLRFNGHPLQEIAMNVDRSVCCVWNITKDVTNLRWNMDRVIQRPSRGGRVALVHRAELLMV